MTGSGGIIGGIISTHSLTRRLTRFPAASHRQARYFNSQPHEEADKFQCQFFLRHVYFNSQPHEEADKYFNIF